MGSIQTPHPWPCPHSMLKSNCWCPKSPAFLLQQGAHGLEETPWRSQNVDACNCPQTLPLHLTSKHEERDSWLLTLYPSPNMNFQLVDLWMVKGSHEPLPSSWTGDTYTIPRAMLTSGGHRISGNEPCQGLKGLKVEVLNFGKWSQNIKRIQKGPKDQTPSAKGMPKGQSFPCCSCSSKVCCCFLHLKLCDVSLAIMATEILSISGALLSTRVSPAPPERNADVRNLSNRLQKI